MGYSKKDIAECFDLWCLENNYRDSDRLSNNEKFTVKHMNLAFECELNYEYLGYYCPNNELSDNQNNLREEKIAEEVLA